VSVDVMIRFDLDLGRCYLLALTRIILAMLLSLSLRTYRRRKRHKQRYSGQLLLLRTGHFELGRWQILISAPEGRPDSGREPFVIFDDGNLTHGRQRSAVPQRRNQRYSRQNEDTQDPFRRRAVGAVRAICCIPRGHRCCCPASTETSLPIDTVSDNWGNHPAPDVKCL